MFGRKKEYVPYIPVWQIRIITNTGEIVEYPKSEYHYELIDREILYVRDRTNTVVGVFPHISGVYLRDSGRDWYAV